MVKKYTVDEAVLSSKFGSKLYLVDYDDYAAIEKERDALKAQIREMINKAADKYLSGYRELGNKCAELEIKNDSFKRENATLEKRIDDALRVLAMGHTEREREAWRILKGGGDGQGTN